MQDAKKGMIFRVVAMVVLLGIDPSFAGVGSKNGNWEGVFFGVVFQPKSAVAGEAVGRALELDFILVLNINLEAHGAVVARVVKEIEIGNLQDKLHPRSFDGVRAAGVQGIEIVAWSLEIQQQRVGCGGV